MTLRGIRTRGDTKLAALARTDGFAVLSRRKLLWLGSVLDRGWISNGAHLAVRGRRVVQPLIVREGIVLIDGAEHQGCVTVGLRATAPAGLSCATVSAGTDLDVWYVDPRSVNSLVAIVPSLALHEATVP